jgi:hypothetical protein
LDWAKRLMEKYGITGTELKNKFFILLLCCFCVSVVNAQKWNWWPLMIDGSVECADTIFYHTQLSAVASSGEAAPFLFRTNHRANISSSPYSANISAGIKKMPTCHTRWWDYDFAVQLTGRVGTHDLTAYFQQLYAHTRLWVVDLTAGIAPLTCGAQSQFLTSGSLLFSENAHAIPHVSIGINNYVPFPGLFGYVELKGGLVHGWLNDRSAVKKVKLHYKFAGLRLGGASPVSLAYEIHHAAQWGGYNATLNYGNTFADWWNVVLFRSGGVSLSDQLNAQGNHIGFQEFTLAFKHRAWHVKAYWQTIFEDMSARFIGFGTNAADGLWGMNIRQTRWPFIGEVTYEFLNTTSQSGPIHDKDGLVFAGRDSYYNNSAYPQGWTYYSSIIGNPYLQTDNNRVRAHFMGIKGNVYGFHYRMMASYVDNYGSYQRPSRSHNTALLLEVNKHVQKAWGLDFGVALSADFGTQYGNVFGAYLKIAKSGIITTY